jgi:hypothetical protein
VRSTTCYVGGRASAPSPTKPTSSSPSSIMSWPTSPGRRRSPALNCASLLLGTYQSFREMGQRLYISQHTVKSQALSVYRKLGVSSRSQAIQRARTIGLLGC